MGYDFEIEVSKHAKRRFKERTNLPPRAVYKAVRDALEFGAAVEDLPFFHRDRLNRMLRSHDKTGTVFCRVHGGVAYVLRPDANRRVFVLITVLPRYETQEDIAA